MNVKNKIIDVVKILDDIDDYSNSLGDSLSNIDSRICDLMHLIEYNKLKTAQCYRIIQELHKLRLERRKIKNDMDILKVFHKDENKLLNYDHRKFLLNDIKVEEKQLTSSIYKNRIYSEEEINKLMGV